MNHRRFLRRNVADKYLVPFAARALRPCNVFIPELYFRLTDINFFDNLRFGTAVFKIECTDVSPAVFLICIEIDKVFFIKYRINQVIVPRFYRQFGNLAG